MGAGSPSDDPVAWLLELQQRVGRPALWSPQGDEATRHLAEALPLMVMLVSRLRRDRTAEVRAEVVHSWHKALRRRGWQSLPRLDPGAGSPSPTLDSTLAVEDLGQLSRDVAAFLSLFGLPLTASRAELAAESALADTLRVLLPKARALLSGPLCTPKAYAAAYREIVGRWNRDVSVTALQLPDDL